MGKLDTQISRRRFIAGLATAGATLSSPAWALTRREAVTVLTNHNDDTLALFEEAFEKAQSRYRLKLVWLMPPDAMKLLRRKENNGPDVWWQAAPHNHLADLAKEDILQALRIGSAGLPAEIGTVSLLGPDDLYRATQLTAFAFLVNRQAIADQNLPWPGDWDVLAGPAYAEKVALSDPAKVRFGSTLLDLAVQTHGWQKGWALLSAIAGNAVLMPRGLTDEVSSGRQPVALHIDTVPNAEQRFRQPLERVYPAHGGIVNVGYIGILKGSKQPAGARAFAEFVLSDEGQRLLPRTDLPRLPVRPKVYEQLGERQFNPFVAQQQGKLAFEASENFSRSAILTALFGALTEDQAALARLWARLHAAERRTPSGQPAQLLEARQALESTPLAESALHSTELIEAFRPPRGLLDPTAQPAEAAKGHIAAWQQGYRTNQALAARLLDEVKA